MNDMNQPQLITQMSQSQGMNQAMNKMNQPNAVNQSQVLNHVNFLNQTPVVNPSNLMSRSQGLTQAQMMNQPQMLNLGYGIWTPQPVMDSMKFTNPMKPAFAAPNPSLQGRGKWKGKKQNDNRRMDKAPVNSGGYRPPTLNELQYQNRLKSRKFYSKKKFNNRFVPFAPRNTTSYIIRAKRSGGIASLVSPCPVTPAVLPTPIFSPSSEVLVDMAKEEWGVDGYGSMKGLIRLRSPGHEVELGHEDEDEDDGGSSESDVEEVERRLDHDLSRFEMIYPNDGGMDQNNILGNRVDDQDTHIAHLEEENLTLKERLFLMEGELDDLRRRMQNLERQNNRVEDFQEEVVENCSENESEGGGGGFHGIADDNTNDDQVVDFVPQIGGIGETVNEEGERACDVAALEDDSLHAPLLEQEKMEEEDGMVGERASDVDLGFKM